MKCRCLMDMTTIKDVRSIPNFAKFLIAPLHKSLSQMKHSVVSSLIFKSAQKSVPRDKFVRQPRSTDFVLFGSDDKI